MRRPKVVQLACLLLACLCLLGNGSVSAYSATAQKSILKNTPAYGDDGEDANTASACGSGSGGGLSGNSNEEKIWSYFAGQNLTPIAIAGIMGNFKEENGSFDPAVKQYFTTAAIPPQGDGNTGFGIAQWTAQSRQAKLFGKIDAAGLSKYYGAGYGSPDVNQQTIPQEDNDKLLQVELDFAWNDDPQATIKSLASELNAKTTVEGNDGSTMYFHKTFEGSDDDASQLQERIDSANEILGKLGSNSCGSLGGVASLEDGIAWAKKFVSDTVAKYHVSTTDLGERRNGDKSIQIATLSDSPTAAMAGGGCWGATYCGQCVALTGWFVTNETGYEFASGPNGRNGRYIVGNLKAIGVKTGTDPKPFSVFSTAETSTPSAGHTGVILGVLPNGDSIVLQNNIISHTVTIDIFDIKATYSDVTFAYVGDKLKSNIGGASDE